MSLNDTLLIVNDSNLSAADKVKIVRLLTLISKSSRDMTCWELQLAREYAGLTRSQAAEQINKGLRDHIGPSNIKSWEEELPPQADHYYDRMDDVYGLAAQPPAVL